MGRWQGMHRRCTGTGLIGKYTCSQTADNQVLQMCIFTGLLTIGKIHPHPAPPPPHTPQQNTSERHDCITVCRQVGTFTFSPTNRYSNTVDGDFSKLWTPTFCLVLDRNQKGTKDSTGGTAREPASPRLSLRPSPRQTRSRAGSPRTTPFGRSKRRRGNQVYVCLALSTCIYTYVLWVVCIYMYIYSYRVYIYAYIYIYTYMYIYTHTHAHLACTNTYFTTTAATAPLPLQGTCYSRSSETTKNKGQTGTCSHQAGCWLWDSDPEDPHHYLKNMYTRLAYMLLLSPSKGNHGEVEVHPGSHE